MKIFLLRHGESTSDVENRYGGDYDDHLTEKGTSQSRGLAQKLLDKGIEIIFSSPKIRARQTAEILKDAFGCQFEIVDDIRERNHYGILTGMEKTEAAEKYPELVEKLKDHRHHIEGSEGYEDFLQRIERAIREITNTPYSTLAIVTHGGPIRAAFRDIFKFGELVSPLGDCAIIELEMGTGGYKIVNLEGAALLGK